MGVHMYVGDPFLFLYILVVITVYMNSIGCPEKVYELLKRYSYVLREKVKHI